LLNKLFIVDKFKSILRTYIRRNKISQDVISIEVGDSQQAVSDFLKKDSKAQKKTRKKYLDNLKGFKDYYESKVDESAFKEDMKPLPIKKLSDKEKQIINDAFLLNKEEVINLPAVVAVFDAIYLKKENDELKRKLEEAKNP